MHEPRKLLAAHAGPELEYAVGGVVLDEAGFWFRELEPFPIREAEPEPRNMQGVKFKVPSALIGGCSCRARRLQPEWTFGGGTSRTILEDAYG